MALEKKDIDLVAQELKGTFDEFTKKNDQRLNAIESEKGALAGSVETLNEKLSEFDNIKSNLEDLMKKQNRPGSTSQDQEEYKSAFGKFVRKGDSTELETKDVNVGTDSDGGFAVPEELDRNILQLERDMSPMRQLCSSIMVGSDEYKRLVNLGGAASGWVGEDDARPKTDAPTLASIAAFMGEIYANPAATQKSLDDIYFNVETWLQEEIAREFAEKEGLAFLTGDGSGKPKGLMAYTMTAEADSARAFGSFQYVESATASTFDGDDLIKLVYSLKQAYRRTSSWMTNSQTVLAARMLKDDQENYLWQPGLQADQPSLLLGRPIAENEDMPAVADNANALAFGDFRRGYTIVDRIGTRMLRDPYTNKPNVQFYTTRRTGGMATDTQAIKFLKVKAAE
ncbi:phage major capsid protein [Psychrosphaera sp. 1_MG-2023]|uniref:phage major capsid protein n=1 Tax=Psychrosphaera sp. 1_MG-2023 TaxID=3062643 RepID=UPI0026E25AC3|nr:phage major capsid protein [Psychrosphaera sp. 1_MG-2023]MDO6718820.1 phage major capsid protein [Psychrosphaera sp. 1_MG-2023]